MLSEIKFMRELGDNIKSAMDERRVTQQELADMIGVDKSTISRYVRGEAMPTLKNMVNISHVLGYDIGEFAFTDEFIG